MLLQRKLPALFALTCSLVSAVALGNERHFTQTYESATLPAGEKELELWLTPRLRRDNEYVQNPYARLDARAELEIGVLDQLQTSLYLNLDAIGTGSPMQAQFELSASNEWKYKLLDAVANPVGLSLYGEVTAGLRKVELEGKLILDKQIGNLVIAFNAVGEHEWQFIAGAVTPASMATGVLGAAYLVPLGGGNRLGLGAETSAESLFVEGEGYESTTFLAGPTLGFASRFFWVAASFMPQLGSIKSPAFATRSLGTLELHSHERYTARLLIGIHL